MSYTEWVFYLETSKILFFAITVPSFANRKIFSNKTYVFFNGKLKFGIKNRGSDLKLKFAKKYIILDVSR